MLKQSSSLLVIIFQYIIKGIAYLFKGIGWYIKNTDDLFRTLLKKDMKHPKNKGEVL